MGCEPPARAAHAALGHRPRWALGHRLVAMCKRRGRPKWVDGSLRCSFCGKAKDQVINLIAGPGVYICDNCVGLCEEIIEKERASAR